MKSQHEVLILGSGSGSNAEEIVKYAQSNKLPIKFIGGCNKAPGKAGIYERLQKLGVEVKHMPSNDDFAAIREFLLKNPEVQLTALAGYMMFLPDDMVADNDIINIHPSIFPLYQGSKDAYADAIEAGDYYSGATVHKATSDHDAGPVIAQLAFERSEFWDLDTFRQIGLSHEHAFYPIVLANRAMGAEKGLDMEKIAATAQKNLEQRDLPVATTIIPANGTSKFNGFDAKSFDARFMKRYSGR
ncbi:MAG: hypothetical protein FWD15_01360 [Alphaproteobacteria bacterium]|nr:hypothetical protein [Alphaproteobacteria bacterium]